MKTLLLSSEDIARTVRAVGVDRLLDDVITGLESACLNFTSDTYDVPVRAGFSYEHEHVGLLEWMPIIRHGDRVAMKLVAYHPENPQRYQLPTILSTALVFDTRHGHVDCIVDATFLTSIRTGAASAVASGVLASPSSKTVGLVGAGAQAVTQLHALTRRFDIEHVNITDCDAGSSASFAERVALAGVDCRIEVTDIDRVVGDADILCTATSIDAGSGPLFDGLPYRRHLHVNAVGSDFPGKTELPLTLLQDSLVCPDFNAQALAEGECQQLEVDEIGPDLATLVKQRQHYAAHRAVPTVFDSTGWALEDLVCVEILWQLAQEHGFGRPVELESISVDPKSPYGFLDDSVTLPEQLAARIMRA